MYMMPVFVKCAMNDVSQKEKNLTKFAETAAFALYESSACRIIRKKMDLSCRLNLRK
jgi:hypothetical protein